MNTIIILYQPIRMQESCSLFVGIPLSNLPIVHRIDCVGPCIFYDITMV